MKKINNIFDVQWHITEKCNLRCKHCYMDKYYNEATLKELLCDYNLLKKFIIKLNSFLEISITGGEPLVYPEFINLLKFLDSEEIVLKINILTNGVLLNDEICLFLSSLPKFNFIQISIEGLEKTNDLIRGSGIFNKIIEKLKLLIKYKMKIQIQTVLTKLNYNDIIDLILFLENFKYPINYLLTRYVPSKNELIKNNILISKNEYKSILEKLESLSKNLKYVSILKRRSLWKLINEKYGGRCPIGINSFDLLYDGSIMLCRRLNLKIGNIRYNSLYKIWYGNDLIWDIRKQNKINNKCKNCKYLKTCYGCRAMAFAYFGDIFAEDPHCWK